MRGREVNSPIVLLKLEGKFDVVVLVDGGGTTGQAGAIRLGVAPGSCWCSQPWYLSPNGSLCLLRDLFDLEDLRLLGGVRVLRTCEDAQTGQLDLGELVLRQHALDGVHDDALRLVLEQLGVAVATQTAGTAGPVVKPADILVDCCVSLRGPSKRFPTRHKDFQGAHGNEIRIERSP